MHKQYVLHESISNGWRISKYTLVTMYEFRFLKSYVKPCYITYAWLSFKNEWWFKDLEIYVYFPFLEIENANSV